jgi:hypothetical protein
VTSEHRLVIVRRDADGGLSALRVDDALPCIESVERRSADVTELNRAVRASLGLEVSVLRCIGDEPGDERRPRRHLYLMETHGEPGAAPAGGRWVKDVDVAALATIDGADWAEPGWRDGVVRWVNDQLARSGTGPVTQIEQVRVWEFSQVLRLQTAGATFYFKARSRPGAAEAPLTRRLAARHPRWLPEVVAIDVARRWMLMREATGRELMELGDVARWEEAAAVAARIQLDWLDDTGELAAQGCMTLSLPRLLAEVAPLLDDVETLQPPLPEALGDDEVVALRGRRAELEALCRELDAFGVPESLEHGDLWAANIIATECGPVFLDWEDTAIAHPFITPSLLLLSVDEGSALADLSDARRRIRDAYLRVWTERGPLTGWPRARLERAFDMAQQVAMLHYAVQFRLQLTTIETSREVHGFAPFFLRRLIRP